MPMITSVMSASRLFLEFWWSAWIGDFDHVTKAQQCQPDGCPHVEIGPRQVERWDNLSGAKDQHRHARSQIGEVAAEHRSHHPGHAPNGELQWGSQQHPRTRKGELAASLQRPSRKQEE